MKSFISGKIISLLTLLTLGSTVFYFAPTQAASSLTIDSIEVANVASNANGAQAEISWITSVPSYARIHYGTKTDALDGTYQVSGAAKNQYKITLTGLKGETQYYFTVEAYINTEDVTSFIRTFKTDKATNFYAPELKAVQVAQAMGRSATIIWTTDLPSTGKVIYGTDQNKMNGSAGHGDRTNNHEVTLRGLQPNTKYYYQASSEAADKQNHVYTVEDFVTAPTDGIDKEPLTITRLEPNDTNSPDVGTNSITISLQTNRISKVTLNYRATGGKSGSLQSSGFSVNNHRLTISGLAPSTTYILSVDARDPFGGSKKIDNLTFRTKDLLPSETKITPAQGPSHAYTPALGLVKTADSDTVFALVSNTAQNSACGAYSACLAGSGGSWKADYYDYYKSHPEMNHRDRQPATDSPFVHDWYAQKYYVRSGTDQNLVFGSSYYPLDDLPKEGDAHNYLFGVHWTNYVTAPQTSEYGYALSSDDDTWILIDNKVVINNSGTHGYNGRNGKIAITKGVHKIDIYYADRGATVAGMSFQFTDKTLIMGQAQNCAAIANQCKVQQAKNNRLVMRHAIMTPAAFNAYGYDWKTIRTINNQELQTYAPVVLIRTPNNPTVYYVDTARRLKIPLPSEAIFNAYGYQWSDVVYVNQEDLNAYFTADLVKEPGSSTVYQLEQNTLHPFASGEALTKRGYSFNQVLTINSYHLGYFNRGDSIQ